MWSVLELDPVIGIKISLESYKFSEIENQIGYFRIFSVEWKRERRDRRCVPDWSNDCLGYSLHTDAALAAGCLGGLLSVQTISVACSMDALGTVPAAPFPQ